MWYTTGMLATESETAILKRVIRPEEGGFSREAAEQLLKLAANGRE